MHVSVTFKNIDSSDALKSYVQKKLDRFDKLLDNPAEANVVFSIEKIRHTAEVTLTSDRLNIHAKEETETMYSAIDMVIDKLKKQVNKNRDKVKKPSQQITKQSKTRRTIRRRIHLIIR